ncbi:MAG: PadR family transcriptional regulator [Bifidobacteriaceae bacterium]|jgi:PadR family transcriptional regulator PadR|nr:PadR family transcriptional regulator [Bifidobacteriaceae bacterium]
MDEGHPLVEPGREAEPSNAISPDVIRGYVDTMILAVLRERPSYGYEIAHRIRELTGGAYVMKETTLYSALTRMETRALVESFDGGATHGRPRVYYRVTGLGQDYCRAKCAEWRLTQEIVLKFIDQKEVA